MFKPFKNKALEIHCTSIDKVDLKEWEQLFQSNKTSTPFQSPTYIKHWINSFSNNDDVFFLEINIPDRLIGMIPLRLVDLNPFVRQIEILGTGSVNKFPDGFADRTGFLIDDDYVSITSDIVRYIINEVDNKTSILFRYLQEETKQFYQIRIELEKQKIDAFCKISSHSLFTDFPDTWDEFILSWSKKRQRTYKGIINKLKRKGHLDVTLYMGENYKPEIFNYVELIDEKSWKADSKSNHLPNIRIQKFFRNIFNDLCPQGKASVAILMINGVPVAYELDFWHHNYVYAYIKSYDENYFRFSPGTYLSYFVMQMAIERKMIIYDQLRGDESYKKGISPNSNIDKDFLILPKSPITKLIARLYYIVFPKGKYFLRNKLGYIGFLSPFDTSMDIWNKIK